MNSFTPKDILSFVLTDVKTLEVEEGTLYFALSNKWLLRLRMAERKDEGTFKIPINNQHLVASDGGIRETVQIPGDFVVISGGAWDQLVERFGGGPALQIKYVKHPVTEKLIIKPRNIHCVGKFVKFSKKFEMPYDATAGDVKIFMAKTFNQEPLKARLWTHNRGVILDDKEYLLDMNKMTKPSFLMEVMDDTGAFEPEFCPPKTKDGNRAFEPEFCSPKTEDETNHNQSHKVLKPGYVGIRNSGNTCYINAVLQCLAHNKLFVDNIKVTANNTEKNLVFVGIIRDIFMKLTEGYDSPIGISELMDYIKQNNQKFTHGQQHDSHEFLLYLLYELGDKNTTIKFKKEITCSSCGQSYISYPIDSTLIVNLNDDCNLIFVFVPYDRSLAPRIIRREKYGGDLKKEIEEETHSNVAFFSLEKGGFTLSHPTSSSNGVFFAYEVPNVNSMYALAPVYISEIKNREKEIVLPILVDVGKNDKTRDIMESIISEQLCIYWKTKCHSKIADEIEVKLSPGVKQDKRKHEGIFPQNFSPNPYCTYIANEKILIKLNTAHTRESEGFDWGYVVETSAQVIAPSTSKTSLSLKNLIGTLGKTISIEEQYSCTNCNKNSCPQISSEIWSLPSLLIITLARFTFDGIAKKNNARVNIPSSLTLTENSSNKEVSYKLESILLHTGSCFGGHYKCIYKVSNEKWVIFNDKEVEEVSANTIDIEESAYMLFYTKDESPPNS